MQKEIFDDISRIIASGDMDKAVPVGDFESFGISEDNFFQIHTTGSAKDIAFVDGGSCVIVESPSFCLGFVRAVAIVMSKNKTKKVHANEFFVAAFAKAEGTSGKIFYETKYYSNSNTSFMIEPIRVESIDTDISNKNERVRISRMVDFARRSLELELASKIVDDMDEGDYLIIDGNLRSFFPGEDLMIAKTAKKAFLSNVFFGGLGKTSNILTDSGDSLTGALHKKSPQGKWFYHPAFESNDPKHDARTFFMKLNEHSDYIFSLDMPKEISKNADFGKIFGFLAYCSKDIAFPGYPYGLIKADRLARISNNESEILLRRFSSIDPGLYSLLKPYINSLNSHSVLDSMG